MIQDAKSQPPSSQERSLGELFTSLWTDLTALIRQEIHLAHTEFTQKAGAMRDGSGKIVSGGLLAYVGVLALLLTLMLVLAKFLPLWVAGLVVGLLTIGGSLLLFQVGYRTFRQLSLLPQQAITEFHADIATLKATAEPQVAPQIRQTLARTLSTQKSKQASGVREGSTPTSWWQLLKTTVQEWVADEASLLAAALSYYTAISLAPLLVLLVVIIGFFLNQDTARTQLLEQLRSAIGTQGAQFLEIILENADQPGIASLAGVLSFLTLLWGSTNVFSQLQNSLNKIWDVEPKPGRGIWATVQERLLSFSLVLGVAFLLLVSFVLSAALTALSGLGESWLPGLDWLWQLINFIVSFGVITLLFAAIYKVLPDAKVAWRDVWMGAAVTALLFTVGKTLLGWYLANAGTTYGAAGSLIVFLLWVYYSAQILFFGAEFTQVYARAYGAGIQPSAGAQRISTNA